MGSHRPQRCPACDWRLTADMEIPWVGDRPDMPDIHCPQCISTYTTHARLSTARERNRSGFYRSSQNV
eukprot:g79803.t1